MSEAGLAPVITIDGPSASGKGTVAQQVALALGWHYLDSGALYRLVALGAMRGLAGAENRRSLSLDESDEAALAAFAARLPVHFEADRILLEGEEVADAIRAEEVGSAASRIAVMPAVREALVARQQAFRRPPGLVADGRDMGTMIFRDAALKVFLTASAESRAERRYKQLIGKGFSVTLPSLLQDLRERDRRDASRTLAPLVPAEDALVVDSTALDIDQTVERVLEAWREREHR